MNKLRELSLKKKNDAFLFIIISYLLITTQTWFFKSNLTLLKVELLIRILFPLLLIVLFKKYKLPSKACIIIVCYYILVLYIVLMIPFEENPTLIAVLTAKYLYILIFPTALLLILRPFNFSYSFLYITPYLGFFFAIQAIILFILIQTGNSPTARILILVGYKNLNVLSFGFWGYANGMQAIGDSLLQVYRAQSFFAEPTQFAAFLEVSTFISFGLYKIKKDKIMLLIFVVCSIALLLTFSMTTYITVFATICIYLIITSWQKLNYLAPMISSILIIFGIILITIYLQIATSSSFYGQSKISMAFGHSPNELQSRYSFLIDSLHLLKDYPFGIGLIGTENSTILLNYLGAGDSNMAPLFWSRVAGIIGLVIQLFIILYIVNTIIIKQIRKPNKIGKYICISFIALILHQCIAGDWFNPMFFYLLSIIVVTDAYEFSFLDGRNILLE